MSEVDRLSNSGLYPALPIADRKRDREAADGRQSPASRRDKAASKEPEKSPPDASRPPKTGIDEYA
jgi:hypothetical protein